MFEREGVLLQGDPIFDDTSVIGFQVTVFLGKDISKLFHQNTKFLPLINSKLSGYIYGFWMTLATYVFLLDSRIFLIFGRLKRDIIRIK